CTAVQDDGGVLIGGLFVSFNSTARHGVARLRGDIPIVASNPTLSGHRFSVSVPTESGKSYYLEYKTSLGDSSWTTILPAVTGSGATLTLADNLATGAKRFYRVRVQ